MPSRRLHGAAERKCAVSIEDENVVAGRMMERSFADFVRACEVHILEESSKANGDTALIALLCDAVRLARETVDSVRRRVAMPGGAR